MAEKVKKPAIFLEAVDPMIIIDPSGRILDLNIEAARTYGRSRRDLISLPDVICTLAKQRH